MEDRTQVLLSSQSKALQAHSKVIDLRDISAILYATDNNNDVVVSGCLDWKSCLSSAFGSAFDRLRGLESTSGSALGCAARTYGAVADAELSIDYET